MSPAQLAVLGLAAAVSGASGLDHAIHNGDALSWALVSAGFGFSLYLFLTVAVVLLRRRRPDRAP
ncbi:hypothetical protein [uncultured Jatrophihabitans sp.]|uniref:hypothetical protein n=1 Tax=uncultured Jatrophihabitans sp. TaxID=1610747 RepID=UPI0035CC11BC